MDHATKPDEPSTGEVVSFDEALLGSCPAGLRGELLSEARLLIQAFAPERRIHEVEAMAHTLSNGGRDAEIGRERGRRLAAALRHLISHPDA
jgi:hypothetical protein